MAYLSKMRRELNLDRDSDVLRLLVDMGIDRREEILGMDQLLKVAVSTLTLLRRMAEGVDESFIDQSRKDTEIMIASLKENNQ